MNETNTFTILGRFIEVIDDLNDEVVFTVNFDNNKVTIYSSKDLLPTINK